MTNTAVLLEKIKQENPAVRLHATRAMKAFPGNVEIVRALCEALGDENKGVQNASLEALSNMKHENVVNQLVEVIKSSDLNVRNAGMTALRNIGALAIIYLKKTIDASQDVDEIIQILVVLGDIKSSLATDVLIHYTSHDDDNVKTTAVESLGKVQDPKAVPVLMELYKTYDILKYAIVEALGNIGVSEVIPFLLSALESGDVIEYFTSIGALGATELPEALNTLFDKLIKEDDITTKKLIIKSIAQIEEANPGLVKTLDSEAFKPALTELATEKDSLEYIYVMNVASALNDRYYVNILLDAIEHSIVEVVAVAVRGLEAIGIDMVPAALQKLEQVEDVVAIRILKLLKKFPSNDIPQNIIRFSTSTNDALRLALAETLAANPNEISFSALKELLDDADENVRRAAVSGVAKMLSFDGALTALIRKFKDINGHVRREACLAMKNSTSEQVIEPLFNVVNTEPYGDVREAAASVLALRKDPEIIRKLLEMLDSENSRIRETISKTIWQCGSVRAVESLISKLTDKEWRVIVNSCNSLENIKDLKSIYSLKELLKDTDWQIRIAALSALRAFNSKELKQFFIPLLGDENAQVAKLAVVALSDLNDRQLVTDFEKYIDHPRWEVRYHIVKALGLLKAQSSVEALVEIIQKDANHGVKYCAAEALAQIDPAVAASSVVKLLDSDDDNLVIAAIKCFNGGSYGIDGVQEKIKQIFIMNPSIKEYFVETIDQNKSEFIEGVLATVLTPRQLRFVEKLKNETKEVAAGDMSTEEAILLRDIVAEKCGLDIADKNVLKNKLQRNLPRFYISSWFEYYHSLRYGAEEGSELLISLYDSITNPTTEFFGELQQTKVLVNNILPEIIEQRVKDGVEEIRILCCGSSFGPETYSIAMSVLEDLHPDNVRISLTGIDISHICLNTAKRGIYKREMFRAVDRKYLDLYFEDDRGDLRVKDEVKNLVEFKFTNTVNSEAMEQLGAYDVVICRNLFTDFSQKGKERMAENIYNVLVPGGAMLISSNESLYNVTKAFKLETLDKVIAYRKM